MKVLIEELIIKHFNLERVENVHLEVNLNLLLYTITYQNIILRSFKTLYL